MWRSDVDWKFKHLGIAAVAACLASPNAASSEPLTASGLQFSDEKGGFRIVSLTGTGRSDDPFVLVEEIT